MSTPNHMTDVLAIIREHGGFAIPMGGGFWTTADGERLAFPNMTRTIYALERRGLLVRRMYRKEPWRDTYACAADAVRHDSFMAKVRT